MTKFFVRLFINAAAIYLAADWITGIQISGSTFDILVVALIFGFVNAILRPIVILLTLPAVVLSLGLFTFVINGLMLWVTQHLSSTLYIADFSSAFWGALAVTFVSWVLNSLIYPKEKESN